MRKVRRKEKDYVYKDQILNIIKNTLNHCFLFFEISYQDFNEEWDRYGKFKMIVSLRNTACQLVDLGLNLSVVEHMALGMLFCNR